MDIARLLRDLTLAEKASLCSGSLAWHTQAIERLGIPQVMVSDGPHGLRKEAAGHGADSVPATCFPRLPRRATSRTETDGIPAASH